MRPGGRCVGELGGNGCVASIREAFATGSRFSAPSREKKLFLTRLEHAHRVVCNPICDGARSSEQFEFSVQSVIALTRYGRVTAELGGNASRREVSDAEVCRHVGLRLHRAVDTGHSGLQSSRGAADRQRPAGRQHGCLRLRRSQRAGSGHVHQQLHPAGVPQRRSELPPVRRQRALRSDGRQRRERGRGHHLPVPIPDRSQEPGHLPLQHRAGDHTGRPRPEHHPDRLRHAGRRSAPDRHGRRSRQPAGDAGVRRHQLDAELRPDDRERRSAAAKRDARVCRSTRRRVLPGPGRGLRSAAATQPDRVISGSRSTGPPGSTCTRSHFRCRSTSSRAAVRAQRTPQTPTRSSVSGRPRAARP